jgi:hypothetical protein
MPGIGLAITVQEAEGEVSEAFHIAIAKTVESHTKLIIGEGDRVEIRDPVV